VIEIRPACSIYSPCSRFACTRLGLAAKDRGQIIKKGGEELMVPPTAVGEIAAKGVRTITKAALLRNEFLSPRMPISS